MQNKRKNQDPIVAWFLKTLERMAASHGARTLAQPHLPPIQPPQYKWLSRIWQGALENLDGNGPRSIANFERAMNRR